MAKTETNVSNLKINRGTYDKIQENNRKRGIINDFPNSWAK